ncbi:hypothetical protein ACIPWF_08950 [Paenarthrobacter sp. NPDC089989]|uniref:hypothetical protein n=1 Tax=unclassified Paenarthrobacter TaxID=2634190 RepID=UPI00382DEC12
MHPLVSAIHETARNNPGKVALRWKCHDFPYAAVDRQINTRALAMQLKGVRAGDLVAFEAVPGPETIVESAALWTLGAGGFPLQPNTREPLPARTILGQATGFMHPDGDYLKAAGVSGQALPFSSAVWLFGGTGPGRTTMDLREFSDVLESVGKRFNLSTRTVLGTTSLVQPGSMIDVWAVLAAGGTVDLIDHLESLSGNCLRQHLRETEADLLVVPSALPQRLGSLAGAVFAQFRDVVVVDSVGRVSRNALADAFPCAIFHHWNPSRGIEDMPDYSPADFVDGIDHKAKDSHA